MIEIKGVRRYLVFEGETYYAAGGWADYVGSVETIEDARRLVTKDGERDEWWQIVDTESGKIVKKGGRAHT